jgi:hypothetical protein
MGPDGTVLLVGVFHGPSGRSLLVRPPGGPVGAPVELPAPLATGGSVRVSMGPAGDAFLFSDAAVAYRPAGGTVGTPQAIAAPVKQVRLNRNGLGVLLAQGPGDQVLAISRAAGAGAQWDTARTQNLGSGGILALALDPDGLAVALWIQDGKLQQAVRAAGAEQFGPATDLPLPPGVFDDGVRSQDRSESDPSGWTIAATAATTGTPRVSAPTHVIATVRAPGQAFTPVRIASQPVGSFAMKGAAINDQGGVLLSYEDSTPTGDRTWLVPGTSTAFAGRFTGGTTDQVIGSGHDLAAISYVGSPQQTRVLRFAGPNAGATGAVDFEAKSVSSWLVDGAGGGLAVVYRTGGSSSDQILRVAQPEPPSALTVALDVPAPVTGDILGVTLSVTNAGAGPLSALTYPSGMGVARDDTVAAGGPALGLSPLAPPVPAFAPFLAEGATGNALLAFEVTSSGTTRLVTRVQATDGGGNVQSADASLRIDSSLRPMSQWELRIAVAGLLTKLEGQIQDVRAKAVKRASDKVRSTIAKSKLKGTKALLKTSKFERALARQNGLPDNALSWLPDVIKYNNSHQLTAAKPGYAELSVVFAAEGTEQFLRTLDTGLSKTAENVVITPAVFWRDYLRGVYNGQEGAINTEIADLGADIAAKGKTVLADARELYTSPQQMTEAWTELGKIYDETSAKIAKYESDSEDRILKWDQLMRDDPRKGTKQFARWLGDIEAGIVQNSVEDLFQDKLISGLATVRKAGKAAEIEDVVDGTLSAGKVTDRLAEKGSTLVTRSGEAARTPVGGLGNLNPDQLDFLSGTVAKLKAKFGVDIELQARPVNAYSANIKDGIGKVEAVPTKNLTPDDIIMGAPQEWLGQTAYYKPTKPKGFDKLPAVEQKRIELRYDEKLKEYKQFVGDLSDPTGKAAKVEKMLKKGGAEVDLGQNYKAKIELSKIEKDGAILIQYKKLEVNGNAVFKGKPRPIVSDIDFNAVIDKATGRNLPASIRGQVELELMNEFSKAQRSGLIPFGFHGWTHSGFDVGSEDFRYVAKYMLMYASEQQALTFARHWAPRFFPELGKIADPRKYEREYRKAVEKILEGYTPGKHLVKITAEGATFGPGVDPTIGIPLP